MSIGSIGGSSPLTQAQKKLDAAEQKYTAALNNAMSSASQSSGLSSSLSSGNVSGSSSSSSSTLSALKGTDEVKKAEAEYQKAKEELEKAEKAEKGDKKDGDKTKTSAVSTSLNLSA